METVLPARVHVCLLIWSISAGSLDELYIKVFVQRTRVLCAVISFYGTRICLHDVTAEDENGKFTIRFVFVIKKRYSVVNAPSRQFNLFIK